MDTSGMDIGESDPIDYVYAHFFFNIIYSWNLAYGIVCYDRQ